MSCEEDCLRMIAGNSSAGTTCVAAPRCVAKVRSPSGVIRVVAVPLVIPLTVEICVSMPRASACRRKKSPVSSSPTEPMNPTLSPNEASAWMVFEALPPVARWRRRWAVALLMAVSCPSSMRVMPPFGNLSVCSSVSSSKWIKTSTKAFPIPIIFVIYRKFFCKSIVFY